MAPRTKLQPREGKAPPDVVVDVEAARAEYDRGEGRELTPEELRRWAETGELPADLEP
jgi:hypothetical protein